LFGVKRGTHGLVSIGQTFGEEAQIE
jgi:hypothetical protein